MQMVWNLKDPALPRTCVRIDRKSPFGNPFVIGKEHGDRAAVIAKYRRWLWNRMQNERRFMLAVAELAGQPLACHCHPLPCHGDVLAKAAAWAASEMKP